MYALVRNGVVTRTFQDVPTAIENTAGFQLMSDAEKKAFGFYTAIDQRPAKPTPAYTYSGDTFTFNGADVIWSATLVDPPTPTQNELDAADAKAYAPLAALAQMTPAQIQTYIQNNVTDLASAKTAIKTLAVAVGILARRI